MKENVLSVDLATEMEKSFIGYALSVIKARAFPDVRDGLKPVQRRIIWAMKELGLAPETNHRKSARIVGDTMGKYHPHGDSSIYDAMVTMSKPWLHALPIVNGHGNFGSVEGDGAAAMRYTEARLSPFAYNYIIGDLGLDVVDFVPNFDGTEKEPEVLPVQVPNLLISGTNGIAVGMADSIPSHNPVESIDAAIAMLERRIRGKQISTEELMQYVKGPDFATGGIIANADDLKEIYELGWGKLRIRGKAHVETVKGGRKQIVITEIPVSMIGHIDQFLSTVATMYREKKLPDVTDIRNLTGKNGIELVIEVKRDADTDLILKKLYKAGLESSYTVNMIAIYKNKIIELNLRRILEIFLDFQEEINTRKYNCLLEKESVKKERLEGLIKAYDVIDLVIAVLRGSKTRQIAMKCLMTGDTSDVKLRTKALEKEAQSFCFTELQAEAILNMRLQSLIGLEIEQLMADLKKSVGLVGKYEKILASESALRTQIKKDLLSIREKLLPDSERRTQLANYDKIELPKEEAVVVPCACVIDRFGYAKLLDQPTYNRNQEGIMAEYKNVFYTDTADKLYLFSSDGFVHQIKLKDVPFTKYKGKGVPYEKLCAYVGDSEILYVEMESVVRNRQLLILTKFGFTKRVSGEEFVSSRKKAQSTKLNDGDSIVFVGGVNNPADSLCMKSEQGYYNRIKVSEIKEYKKSATGVHAIKLAEEDCLVDASMGNAGAGMLGRVSYAKVKLGKLGAKGVKLRK